VKDNMLEHLFGSKTRVKLLNLFLNKPDDAFFIRELTREIDTQINAVRREIDNLIKVGLIIEAEDQDDNGQKRPGLKRKYYVVNQNFPLLKEMQSLLGKSHFLMDRRLDKEIIALGDITYLAFMGTFLGKTAPVDLFIIGEITDKDELRRIVQKSETALGFDINYTCLTANEYAYRQDIADRFLASVLNTEQHIAVDKRTKKPVA
jgi:predicted transcriptional regulator